MRTSLRQITIRASLALLIGFAGLGLVAAIGSSSGAISTSTSTAAAMTAVAAGVTSAVADPSSGLPVDLDVLLAADRTGKADVAVTRGAIRRLAAWKRLVHATVVVDVPKLGGLKTIQL